MLLPKGDQSAEEVAKHESEYTQEKCSWVAKEWGKSWPR